MGHTSRVVPIVTALQALGIEVHIACNAAQKEFLARELNNISYWHLPGYDVSYPQTDKSFTLHLLQQLPRIIKKIKYEQQWLAKHLQYEKYDAIISDNRYGFRSSTIPSYIICHQPNVQAARLQTLVRRVHTKLLRQFSQVWIPDSALHNNLSGILSDNSELSSIFIGTLSRLIAKERQIKSGTVLVVLTGPQAAKQYLHDYVLSQLANSTWQLTFVGADVTQKNQNATYAGIVMASTLCDLYASHQVIISRSGYSTIMDLAALELPAILIATKGQTEQEYLADRMEKANWHSGFVVPPDDLAKRIEVHIKRAFSPMPVAESTMLASALAITFAKP
jgi:UDP-N-acetylglucosamine:LPS N-acetylglucosamine transferase